MGKSVLDRFEATSKARQKISSRWDALTPEQQRLIARIAGAACLLISLIGFVLFIRSLS